MKQIQILWSLFNFSIHFIFCWGCPRPPLYNFETIFPPFGAEVCARNFPVNMENLHYGSFELISNKVIAHVLHQFFGKRSLYLNNQNVTQVLKILAIFFLMFNPRVYTTLGLHNKKF